MVTVLLREFEGELDRRIANTRDGKPVRSDPVAAAEKEHPLHVEHCTPGRARHQTTALARARS
ncbi:hypothetical protein AU198_01470 [Mycobacterium sp. GA-1199]|nr:hypothetical protein AU198_01470 [Mycobacterium sp. GA-1199]